MRVDCQTHVFPTEYAEIVARNPAWPSAVRKADGYLVVYGDVQSFLLRPEMYDVGRKLQDMDAAGIDISVLSVNMPGPELLEPELGIEGARVCNDYVAALVQQHPDRFAALACLPWQDATAAQAELDRKIAGLGLRGVMLYSHVGRGPVDAPACEPIYRRIAELGVPVVLHPCVAPWAAELAAYSMVPMVGLMCDQSFAILRLILSGVLERHPTLKVVQPHAGGILPYLWGRIENQTEVMGRGRENITQPPSAYYRRVYLDTVTPSALALRYAYDAAGPERLLFGSDHPWVDISLFTGLIEGMSIPQEDKAMIFSGNARRLFRLGAP